MAEEHWDEHLLDTLPEVLKESVEDIPVVNNSFFKASLLRSFESHSPLERFILRRCKFDWSLYLTKKDQENILFLFTKKEVGEFMVMKTKLNFSVVPMPPSAAQHLELSNSIFKWLLPPFIVMDGKRKEALAKKFEKDDEQCVLLNLGKDQEQLLLVAFQEKSLSKNFKHQKTEFYNSSNKIAEEGEEQKNLLLDFCQVLKHFNKNNFDAHQSVVLQSHLDNELQKMIGQIANCYRQIISVPPTSSDNELLQQGTLNYGVQDFFADITLRLKDNGELAWDYKKDDPFQVQVQLTATQQQQQPIIEIKTFLPDFLLKGKLYEAMLDAVYKKEEEIEIFSEEKMEEKFALEAAEGIELTEKEKKEEKELWGHATFNVLLDKFEKKGWQRHMVEEIFQQCKEEGAFIFRIQRKRKFDTNLFILIGEIHGTKHLLAFKGKFKVYFKNGVPEVRLLRKNSLKILYDNQYKTENKDIKIYFSKLIMFIKNWMDLIRD